MVPIAKVSILWGVCICSYVNKNLRKMKKCRSFRSAFSENEKLTTGKLAFYL